MEDPVRDARTGDQWLRSVIAYLEFRSGDSWRRLCFKNQRDSPERWEALDAIRLLQELRYAPEPETKEARA